MIVLEAYQIERISKKVSKLGQCEWFRKTYGCTLIVHNNNYKPTYHLEFKTPKEETFFLLKYQEEINNPKYPIDELTDLINAWNIGPDDNLDKRL